MFKRLAQNWSWGFLAGDFVWHGEDMAEVIPFIRESVPAGCVPIIPLKDFYRGELRVVPADDLEFAAR